MARPRRLRPDAPVVALDDLARDVQPQAPAEVAAIPRLVRLAETLEDARELLRRQARAAIADAHERGRAIAARLGRQQPDRDGDWPAIRRVAHRVAQQVDEHLLDLVAIHRSLDTRRVDLDRERMARRQRGGDRRDAAQAGEQADGSGRQPRPGPACVGRRRASGAQDRLPSPHRHAPSTFPPGHFSTESAARDPIRARAPLIVRRAALARQSKSGIPRTEHPEAPLPAEGGILREPATGDRRTTVLWPGS